MFRANSPKFPKFRGWSDPPARGVKGSSLALPALLELSPNPRLSAPAPHSTVHTAPPARRVRPLPCSPALPSQNARVGSSSATLPGPAWPPMSCEWSNGPVCLWDQLQDQVSGCQGVGLAGRHSCRLLPRGASVDCDQTSRGSRDAAVGGCWVKAWGRERGELCALCTVSRLQTSGDERGRTARRTAGGCLSRQATSKPRAQTTVPNSPSRSPDLPADGGSIYCTASSLSAPAHLSLAGTGRAGKKGSTPPLQIKLRPPAPNWAKRQVAL